MVAVNFNNYLIMLCSFLNAFIDFLVLLCYNIPPIFKGCFFMPQMGMTTIGQYLNEIGQYKLLTSEEMKELFIKYNEGDESAKELLINSNLRLVVQIAKRFYYSNVQLADLIQEGNIGLIKAIEKFDIQRDFKFSTYAIPMIKQIMQRYIEEKKE